METCKNHHDHAHGNKRRRTREDLQRLLEKVMDSEEVYFQPPASIRMNYPCIVYELEDITPVFADDFPYLLHNSYQVTLMTHDPDDCRIRKIASLPMVRFSRFFAADNINHYVYIMYF